MTEVRELPGKARKPKPADEIAARVRRHLREDRHPGDATVTPLNPGFFAAQRMRAATLARKREARPKIKER